MCKRYGCVCNAHIHILYLYITRYSSALRPCFYPYTIEPHVVGTQILEQHIARTARVLAASAKSTERPYRFAVCHAHVHIRLIPHITFLIPASLYCDSIITRGEPCVEYIYICTAFGIDTIAVRDMTAGLESCAFAGIAVALRYDLHIVKCYMVAEYGMHCP